MQWSYITLKKDMQNQLYVLKKKIQTDTVFNIAPKLKETFT